MNRCKKILLIVFSYFSLIGLVSAVQFHPNPVNPNSPFYISAYVVYEASLEPATDANVTYSIIPGTGVNCLVQSYPQNQNLTNLDGSATFCSGSSGTTVCSVSPLGPVSPSAEQMFTVCVNASKPNFRSSYNSALLNVSTTTCGNGVVESGENCHSCPDDAGCSSGKLCCSDNTCKDICTLLPSCNNNGICEQTESCNCADCFNYQDGCILGDACSGYTNTCGCVATKDGICPLTDLTCANEDPDCISFLTSIFVSGDEYTLNVYWNTTAMLHPPSSIGMSCYLNCDPRESNCDAPEIQKCSYVGTSTSNICQIPDPVYFYDTYDLVVCRAYEPATNSTYSFLSTTFKPYDVDLSVSSFSVTVGQEFALPVTIKNSGLLNDAYEVNVSENNLLFVLYPSQTTDSLSGIPLYNTQQLLYKMKVLALTDTPIGILVSANSTTRPMYGKTVFVQLKSGSASLSEYDIFGVLQIILISSTAFSLLIWKKK